KWLRQPITTASHDGLQVCNFKLSLTGHWRSISVGLRGFAPLLLDGIALGDCDAQVRPERRREECAQDSARFARLADRTLSFAEASFLSGVDRGQTFEGIAATLRRAVLPARASVPRKPEAAGFAHERQLANNRKGESCGRDRSLGSAPDALARVRRLARRVRRGPRFQPRASGNRGAARYIRRGFDGRFDGAGCRHVLQLRGTSPGNRDAENFGASPILRTHRFALASIFCGARRSGRAASRSLARVARGAEEYRRGCSSLCGGA